MSRLALVGAALTASAALAAGLASAAPAPTAPSAAEVSPDAFDAPLAEHGEWLLVAPLGRVWRPRGVAAGWRPYRDGEWAWTDEGWFWHTEEPWGWATYHYGRWSLDPAHGWIWVPGLVWAPAWVAWRVTDEHAGWAPLPPGEATWWKDGPPATADRWTFVPIAQLAGARIDRVAVPRARVPELVRAARPAPPPRAEVEHRRGRPLPPARAVPVPRPADARRRPAADAVPVYRPPPPPGGVRAPAPPHVEQNGEPHEPAPAR